MYELAVQRPHAHTYTIHTHTHTCTLAHFSNVELFWSAIATCGPARTHMCPFASACASICVHILNMYMHLSLYMLSIPYIMYNNVYLLYVHICICVCFCICICAALHSLKLLHSDPTSTLHMPGAEPNNTPNMAFHQTMMDGQNTAIKPGNCRLLVSLIWSELKGW